MGLNFTEQKSFANKNEYITKFNNKLYLIKETNDCKYIIYNVNEGIILGEIQDTLQLAKEYLNAVAYSQLVNLANELGFTSGSRSIYPLTVKYGNDEHVVNSPQEHHEFINSHLKNR